MPKRTYREALGAGAGKAAAPKSAKKYDMKLLLKKMALAKKFGTKQEVQPEVKFMDWDVINTAAVNSTGSVLCVNSVGEGSDYNARIGRKINMTSIEYNMMYSAATGGLEGTGPGYADALRFVVVYDRQPTGSLPAWSDLFETSAVVNSPMLHRNVNNLDRFEILASEFMDINTGDNSKCFSRYVKMHHDTRYSATGSGIANIASGALYVMYADCIAIASEYAYLTGRVRVRFTDM